MRSNSGLDPKGMARYDLKAMNSATFKQLSVGWGIVRLLALLLAAGWVGSASGLQAQAPRIVSVTPADGATAVRDTDPLVIVFDRDMDVNVMVFVSPTPGLVGNLAIVPSGALSQFTGEWGEDGRTLTIQPASQQWPLNATISWTLNPAGVFSFFEIKSAAGVALASVSGSFSTGVGGPGLGLVTPVDNQLDVPTNATVTFRFTQPMEKITLPGGTPPAIVWTGAGLDASKFRYTWSPDGQSLGVDYVGGFPLKTRVDWALNPAGATTLFESVSGKPLASDTYRGGFTTAATTPCDEGPIPSTWGSYGLTKRSDFRQTSTADPVPETKGDDVPAPDVFSVDVASPDLGPEVTAASIQLPNGTRTDLTNFFGRVFFFDVLDTEAELDATYPPGNYTLRFTQTGQAERVIPMNMRASDVPPVPKVSNFVEAQVVNAGQNFTLRWNSFANASASDLISLFLTDEQGDVVFQAPDYCIPRPLLATDTSIVIPAGTLLTNHVYGAELLFGKFFYFSTNTVPEMSGYGYRLRGTRFTVKTGTGGTPDQPAVLSDARVLANGRTAFDLSGTAGRTYGIQRASSVDAASWPEVGTVVANGSGAATFEDSQVLGAQPWFYRAVQK